MHDEKKWTIQLYTKKLFWLVYGFNHLCKLEVISKCNYINKTLIHKIAWVRESSYFQRINVD